MSKDEFDIDAVLDESERLQRSLLYDVMIPRNLDEMLSVVFEGPEHEYCGSYSDVSNCFGCVSGCPTYHRMPPMWDCYDAFISWHDHPANLLQACAQNAWRAIRKDSSFVNLHRRLCAIQDLSDESRLSPELSAYGQDCLTRLKNRIEPLTWPVFLFLYENPDFGVDDVEG